MRGAPECDGSEEAGGRGEGREGESETQGGREPVAWSSLTLCTDEVVGRHIPGGPSLVECVCSERAMWGGEATCPAVCCFAVELG